MLFRSITHGTGPGGTGRPGAAQEESQGAGQFTDMLRRDFINGPRGVNFQHIHFSQLDTVLSAGALAQSRQGVIDSLKPLHIPFQRIHEYTVQNMPQHLCHGRIAAEPTLMPGTDVAGDTNHQ